MDKSKEISWLGARLREPSTYAGLALLLTSVFHFSHANEWASVITSFGIAIGGAIAILVPEANT